MAPDLPRDLTEGCSAAEGARPARRLPARLAVSALAMGASIVSVSFTSAAAATPVPEPSAIGNQAVTWIAVSPMYKQTGLVVAVANPMSGCTDKATGCIAMWVSHDGGSTWAKSAGKGSNGPSRPTIALFDGKEVILNGNRGLQRSDDYGDTWTSFGSDGTPSASPHSDADGTVAVAGLLNPDYLVVKGATQSVQGSGGSLADTSFAFAPGYPDGGAYSPVLLSAADKQTGLPIIQKCTRQFACSGTASLPGAGKFAIPVSLYLTGDYASRGVVFAQSGQGIFKSLDGGGSFVAVPLGLAGATATATPQFALAPGYAEGGSVRTAYVALFQAFSSSDGRTTHTGGGVYGSTNGGTTWTALGSPSPLDSGATAVAVAPDGRLFAGYLSGTTSSAGLLCSNNGGTTWKVSCPVVGNWAATHGGKGTSASSGGCGTKCASAAGGGSAQGGGGAETSASANPGAADGRGDNPSGTSGGLSVAGAHASRSPLLIIAAVLGGLVVIAGGVQLLRKRKLGA